MRIEAELDEIHGERLELLRQRLQKPIPEVLELIIDWAIAHPPETGTALPEPMSVGQWPDINLSRSELYGDDGR